MADNPFSDFTVTPPASGGVNANNPNPFSDFALTPQDWRSTPDAQNTAAVAGLGARGGIRALLGPLNLIAGATQGFGGALPVPVDESAGFANAVTGQPTLTPEKPPPFQPWEPSEAVIKGIGNVTGKPLELGPDASPAMQTADQVVPWLFPTGNQFTRLKEAAGPFNKVMTGARSELGNVTDWFLSDEGQQWAREHNMGPVAEMLASLVGSSFRHGVSAVTGKTMPIIAGRPGDESGQNYDVNRAIGVTPPLKSVADPDSSFGRLSSGISAFPFSGTGEAGAIKAQEGAITDTANSALQQFAPGSTRVEDAGPQSLNDFTTDIGNQGRAKILNDELELKNRSDTIEAQIDRNRRVSAQPVLDAALSVATDPNAGSSVRSAAEAAYHRIVSNVDPVTGTIAFNALKTERSTFGALVDNMFQPSSGARSAKDTVARDISPIENAMSAQMQQAANDAGQGPAWSQLDQDWRAHGLVKRNLADTAGVLGDANAPQPWETYAPSDSTASSLISAVRGGDMPTLTKLSSLNLDTTNRAIAETIAAKGQPAHPKSGESFRPDVFGQGASSSVSPNVMTHIESQAPGAGAQLQQAIDAAKTTAEPMERGGLRRLLGSIGAGGAATLGAHGILGTAGVGALPLTTLLTSALHDPSLIRAVAGRQFTADNIPGLLTQYATHAGLGTRPDPLDPVATMKAGLGNAAGLITRASASVPDVTSTLLKYLSGGQR